MHNYSKNEVVLVRYPFTDLSSSKIRPAVIVSVPHSSEDVFVVPLTSKTASLLSGELAMITVLANATVGCGVYPRPEWEGVKPSPTMAETMIKAEKRFI